MAISLLLSLISAKYAGKICRYTCSLWISTNGERDCQSEEPSLRSLRKLHLESQNYLSCVGNLMLSYRDDILILYEKG